VQVSAFFPMRSWITWAPIPNLPWFTWGYWLFILTTPVQFIGRLGILQGGCYSSKGEESQHGLSHCLGTTTAYVYSAIVLFFPNLLPVSNKNVYFDSIKFIINNV
jgi:Cu+-exporting ATPase